MEAIGMTAGLQRYNGQLSFTFFIPIAKILATKRPTNMTIITIVNAISVDFISTDSLYLI
jgi:hypothetical protein